MVFLHEHNSFFLRDFGPNKHSANPPIICTPLWLHPLLQRELFLMLSLLITQRWLERIPLRRCTHSGVLKSGLKYVCAGRDDTSVPSTITFHVVVAVLDTICGITASQDTLDYSASARRALHWHFWEVGDVCDLHKWRLCAYHWLIYCNRVNAVYINIGYLFNHTFTYKHRYTHLFTHPRRHTNTRRPINLLFDSGFNLLSATPLAGPASQLSGNKEAGVWWRGSNRQQHHKSCLSLFEPRCPCTCVQGRELKICRIFGLDVDGGGGIADLLLRQAWFEVMDSSKISFRNDSAAKVKVIVANFSFLGLNYNHLYHVRAANVLPEQQAQSRPETWDQGKKNNTSPQCCKTC